MDVPAGAAKCGHCGAWFVETHLSLVDQALDAFGWAWLVLSVVGAFFIFVSIPSGEPTVYGAASPSMFVGMLGKSAAFAIGVQGVVIGLLLISYAARGPRHAV